MTIDATAMPQPIDTTSGKNRDTENFPVASILIRADLRPHIHAFYAFARAADDVSDHPLVDGPQKVRLLDAFAASLLNDGNDAVPEAAALRRSLQQTGITPQHALDLLTAFKRDTTQLRYRDWADLIDYCNHSAAPVGRYVLALHGIGPSAWPASDAICNALQIINHIQDCADDYRELDRCYIPADMLARHGGDVAALSGERLTPGLRGALQEMLDGLEPLLVEGRALPRQVPDFRLKCEVSVIAVLAERLTALLRQRDPLCENVKLSQWGKMSAAAVGIVRAWL